MLDKEAREWYEKEALGQTWRVRTLQRNALKYKLYLPTEDKLSAKIENQKIISELQQQNKQGLDNN